jgi:hypothetical protein
MHYILLNFIWPKILSPSLGHVRSSSPYSGSYRLFYYFDIGHIVVLKRLIHRDKHQVELHSLRSNTLLPMSYTSTSFSSVLYKAWWRSLWAETCSSLVITYCYTINMTVFNGGLHQMKDFYMFSVCPISKNIVLLLDAYQPLIWSAETLICS